MKPDKIALIISSIVIVGLYIVSIIVVSKDLTYVYMNMYIAIPRIAAFSYLIGMSFTLACLAVKAFNQYLDIKGIPIKKAFKDLEK